MPKDDDDDLFAYTHARSTDPDTSVEAAKSISPRVRALQRRVLAYAAKMPDGFTDRDLEAALNDQGSTWRTRRSELTTMGLIRHSGADRRYPPRKTKHIIWLITMDGLKEAEKTGS